MSCAGVALADHLRPECHEILSMHEVFRRSTLHGTSLLFANYSLPKESFGTNKNKTVIDTKCQCVHSKDNTLVCAAQYLLT